MPLIIYMKNGIQFPVKGESVNPREWRGERMVSKTTMNGTPVMVASGAVAMVELIEQSDYDRMVEEKRMAAESAQAGQGRRISTPTMVIPGGRRN